MVQHPLHRKPLPRKHLLFRHQDLLNLKKSAKMRAWGAPRHWRSLYLSLSLYLYLYLLL